MTRDPGESPHRDVGDSRGGTTPSRRQGGPPNGRRAQRTIRRVPRSALLVLLAAELRLLLRDRRTVLIAIVLPLVLFPVVLLVARAVQRSHTAALQTTELSFAAGGIRTDSAAALLRAALIGAGLEAARFRSVDAADAISALRAGEVDVVIALGAADSAGVPVVLVEFRSDSERSIEAMRIVRQVLDDYRIATRDRALDAAGVPVRIDDIAPVERNDVATPGDRGRALLGMLLTPVLALLLLSGASIVAADAIAGEKERGTLETLLTSAVRRTDIVRAKLLATMAVGVVITAINILNLLVYAGLGVLELPGGIELGITASVLLLVLLLVLPLAALIAAVLLTLSGLARSYREFQVYLLPVLFGFLLPAAAAVLPGVPLRSVIAIVPVANISIAVREVLTGTLDWPFLALAFTVTSASAAAAVRLTTTVLSDERLVGGAELSREELTGGPALFPRRVLRWFAVLWAALLASALWMGDRTDIRVQVGWNLVVLFLGAALLMMRTYRLEPRRALSLRMPHPAAWIAVLIGAPSGYITGIGIGRLAGLLFPVPERVLESFGQYLLPEGMPLWQVLFFLALLPGITEEILFRGLLLHGLRPKLSGLRLCLAVGATFGFFHADLFRIVPTAYLGTVLAGVVLLSGSLLPAVLWHALNNAVALVPAFYGAEPSEPAPWMYAAGVVGLGLALWALRRWRVTPADLHTSDHPPSSAG